MKNGIFIILYWELYNCNTNFWLLFTISVNECIFSIEKGTIAIGSHCRESKDTVELETSEDIGSTRLGNESQSVLDNQLQFSVCFDEPEMTMYRPKTMVGGGSGYFQRVMAEMKAEIVSKRSERRETFKMVAKMGAKQKNELNTTSVNRNEKPELDGSHMNGAIDVNNRSLSNNRRHRKLSTFRDRSRDQSRKRKQEIRKAYDVAGNGAIQMTTDQKCREDLYSRYLYYPESWTQGLSQYPSFLLENGVGSNGRKARPSTACALMTSKSTCPDGRRCFYASHKSDVKQSQNRGRPMSGPF